MFVLSQFFRAANAVIAKTLSAEFGLSPESLGLFTGMFFLAFGATQIPVGMLFDRFGARRTVPVVLSAVIGGSILFGLAQGEAILIAGRLLLGVGCSSVLMGSLFLFGQWAPVAAFSTRMGRMIAIGGAGLLSTTPLAAIAEDLGWRTAFWGAAGLTALGAVAIYALARDRPASDATHTVPAEGLRGVRAALATPGFPTLTLMGFSSYPVVITVLGLWGGPYLADRHGLAPVEAGNALLVMAIAFMGRPAVLQALGGVIVGAFSAANGAAPAIAYRALFASLAALVALACLAYLRLPDARPSAGFATDLPPRGTG